MKAIKAVFNTAVRRRTVRWGAAVLAAGLCLAGGDAPGRSAAQPRAQTQLFLYNNARDMLDGDLWDVTTSQWVARDFRGTPNGWPVIGVGTTSEAFHNGELIAAGTYPRGPIWWAQPQDEQRLTPVTNQDIPFLALARCNPADDISVDAVAGQPIHPQIVQLAQARGVSLAAVWVTGTFDDLQGTIAYHLRKEGSPLNQPGVDNTEYLLPFAEPGRTQWDLAGFYIASPETQPLLSFPGSPVHFHGIRADRRRGGHVGLATVAKARIHMFPIASTVTRKCDLSVKNVIITGQTIRFTVTNPGTMGVTYLPVKGVTGAGKPLFKVVLTNLAPGASRNVALNPLWPDQQRSATVMVDPDHEIFESDEANNTAVSPP